MKIRIIKNMIYRNSHQLFILRDFISNLSDNSIFSISCDLFSSKWTFIFERRYIAKKRETITLVPAKNNIFVSEVLSKKYICIKRATKDIKAKIKNTFGNFFVYLNLEHTYLTPFIVINYFYIIFF